MSDTSDRNLIEQARATIDAKLDEIQEAAGVAADQIVAKLNEVSAKIDEVQQAWADRQAQQQPPTA